MNSTFGSPAGATTAVGASDESNYQWLAIPISVRGLNSLCEFVPVSCRISFPEFLSHVGVSGAVDEHSLRLYRVVGRRREEVVCQFTADEQPRPKTRPLLSGTSPNVSYLGEHVAGETPAEIQTRGQLLWIARGTAEGSENYLLRFGVLKKGRLIQIPYAPQNLHAFDEAGRATPVRWFPSMQFHPQWPVDGLVQIFRDQHLLTAYRIGPLTNQSDTTIRRPFFYPVIGPDEIALTEFGKPHDPTGSHAHHYSLWIAHANVNGVDFWSKRGGHIDHVQFAEMEDGPLACHFLQRLQWTQSGEAILAEQRRVRFYQTPPDFRLFDVELELTPANTKPVTLGKTSFGFLAVRVAQSMTVFDGAGEIRNSSGDLNEQRAHLKRASWIDQSGPIAPGKWGGIALLDHPDNLNYPTGWHCRNDGWAGAAFNMDAPFTLEPGAKLRLRYRVHLHRGDAVRGEVGRRFQEFSAKPTVVVGEAAIEKSAIRR